MCCFFPEAHSSQFQSCGIHTQKSPLKTPVPRRCAPEPVSKNVKISKKENPVTEKENIPKSTSEGIVSKTLLPSTGVDRMAWGLLCVVLFCSELLGCWHLNTYIQNIWKYVWEGLNLWISHS